MLTDNFRGSVQCGMSILHPRGDRYGGWAARAFWVLVVNFSLLSSCAALHQTSSEVFTREPGHRSLEGPKPIGVEAQKDWQFAWLSEAAYGRIPSVKEASADPSPSAAESSDAPSTNKGTVVCEDADIALLRAGWEPWSDFPGAELAKKIEKSNLRVEVWERKEPPAVAVAFGGTIFTSWKDWRSNLRWFIPLHMDEYTELVNEFEPAFVAEFSRRAREPGRPYLKVATIYSTGHSLGGGLAQQFAYSLPIDQNVQRVAQVYAFDPSPVTGFYSVKSKTRNINKEGLLIDRISFNLALKAKLWWRIFVV